MMLIPVYTGVYLIEHIPSGLWYIGSSSNVHHRWATHFRDRVKWGLEDSAAADFAIFLLEECKGSRLEREQFWLETLEPELNVHLSTSPPRNQFIKVSRSEVLEVVDLLSKHSTREVCKITGVSLGIIKSVASGSSHKWVAEEFPEKWYKMQEANKKRRQPADKYAGTVLVNKTTGEEFTIKVSQTEFTTLYGYPKYAISKLLLGTRNSYRGWYIKEKYNE